MTRPRPPVLVRSTPRPARVRLALLLLAVLALGSCQRRTSYVVIGEDSSAVMPEDSLAAEMRRTQQLWEGGADPETASNASARVLQADLGAHEPTTWRERAGYVLDSLGVGAELADAPCVIAVNFFSRSDPDAGAWPYLFWCGKDHVMMQAVEGKGLRLQSLWSTGLVQPRPDGVRAVSALLNKRGSGGFQPLVMTWTLGKSGAKWSLVQTLGADSLGGNGTAEFASAADTSVDLSVRTYRTPTGFAECATCPHAYTSGVFHWTPQGFVRVESTVMESPYSSFILFILALQAGDLETAGRYAADPAVVAEAQRYEWQMSKGPWRPAPGTGETSTRMTFFRGPSEAYDVQFQRQGGSWRVSGFAPVDRSIE